jgi:hypothetical protein
MSKEFSFHIENAADTPEWPDPVKVAFLRLVEAAVASDFNVIAAVGLNMKAARAGEVRLSAMFSPNASSNPHRVELCQDIVSLFQGMADRSKQ